MRRAATPIHADVERGGYAWCAMALFIERGNELRRSLIGKAVLMHKDDRYVGRAFLTAYYWSETHNDWLFDAQFTGPFFKPLEAVGGNVVLEVES